LFGLVAPHLDRAPVLGVVAWIEDCQTWRSITLLLEPIDQLIWQASDY
jgi:hypothetical protein